MTARFDDEDHLFCCPGCARVYGVGAATAGLLEQVTAPPPRRAAGGLDFLLSRGETAYFTVDGMWCAGCAVSAERAVGRLPGVLDIEIGFAAERGRLQFDPAKVDPAAALETLDRLGLRATLLDDADKRRAERREERLLLRVVVAWILGMQVMLLYLLRALRLYQRGDYESTTARAFAIMAGAFTTVILFYSGWTFLRGAWRATRVRTVSMDTLIALGTLFAYGDSVVMTVTASGPAYFDAVAMITQIVVLGRYLELTGGARARKDLHRLLALQPERARVRRDGEWREVRVDHAQPGDELLVRPGERVPLDCVVLQGEAAVDESVLTGEANPVLKVPGDEVYAGTVLSGGALVCRVLQRTSASRLAQIAALVDRTLAAKPPVQRIADRASAWFTIVILVAATLTVAGWLVVDGAASDALIHGVAVLVVACPCALGLATPLVLAIVLGRAVRAGVVVRAPSALETAPSVTRVVFDKTGTLTRGSYTVTSITTHDGIAAGREMVCLAAAVEQFSEHPIGAAISSACLAAPPPAEGFRAFAGLGVTAKAGGRQVAVGSGRLAGPARAGAVSAGSAGAVSAGSAGAYPPAPPAPYPPPGAAPSAGRRRGRRHRGLGQSRR